MTKEQREQLAKDMAMRGIGRPTIVKDTGLSHHHVQELLKELDGQRPIPAKSRYKPSERERGLMSEQSKKFDPEATPDDLMADLRSVQERFPTKHINRNFYRAEGKYSDATWNSVFGTFQEFRRRSELELDRYQHQHEKHVAKHASLDVFRSFYGAQIEPNVGLYKRERGGRFKTIQCISDNHDEDQDPFVWRVFCDVARDLQPDVVLFNGDQNDLYEFSRYEIDPRQADAVRKLAFVRDNLFGVIRAILPDTQIDWNLGNHEWRAMKHMAIATPHMRAVLADFMGLTWADLFGVRQFEVNVNCKWDLAAFNRKDIAKQVQQNYIVYWKTFVAMHIRDDGFGLSGTNGHTHRPALVTGANVARGTRSPWNWTTTGSGCRGNAEYMDGLDKSSQGFAIFHVDTETGIVVPENVIIQGDFAAVAGRYWRREPHEQ